MKIRKILREKRGEATVLTVALILGLLLLMCAMAEFFRLVEKKERDAMAVWDTYLEDLSIVITNLRMCFDCDIVLGGYVGGYLRPYMSQLGRKVMVHNKFDNDTLYLRNCRYEKEASAVGIAMTFMDEYFRTII